MRNKMHAHHSDKWWSTCISLTKKYIATNVYLYYKTHTFIIDIRWICIWVHSHIYNTRHHFSRLQWIHKYIQLYVSRHLCTKLLYACRTTSFSYHCCQVIKIYSNILELKYSSITFTINFIFTNILPMTSVLSEDCSYPGMNFLLSDKTICRYTKFRYSRVPDILNQSSYLISLWNIICSTNAEKKQTGEITKMVVVTHLVKRDPWYKQYLLASKYKPKMLSDTCYYIIIYKIINANRLENCSGTFAVCKVLANFKSNAILVFFCALAELEFAAFPKNIITNKKPTH